MPSPCLPPSTPSSLPTLPQHPSLNCPEKSRKEIEDYVDKNFKPKIKSSQLYQNLLKELETGRGKEVLDRIKKDYNVKKDFIIGFNNIVKKDGNFVLENNKGEVLKLKDNTSSVDRIFLSEDEANQYLEANKYTLEEQQEEAIVELMSLMVADKLNKITDKNLISLLKQLLKQINDFIKSLLNTKELNINDIEADNTKFLIENKLKELIKNGIIKKEC